MVQRDIRDYLNDILTYIDIAGDFVEEMTFDEFERDTKTTLALTRAVEIVGEATKQIPLAERELYPSISWKSIIGMRDRIAHAYFGINLKVVWDTAHNDLPELRPVIQSILDKIQASENLL